MIDGALCGGARSARWPKALVMHCQGAPFGEIERRSCSPHDWEPRPSV
jgi:hypothetical protein